MNRTHTAGTRCTSEPSKRYRNRRPSSFSSSETMKPQDFKLKVAAKAETDARRRIEETACSWAFLVDKWMMEKEANERFPSRKVGFIKSSLQDSSSKSDSSSLFYTSTSSSSDSSGALSELEFLGATTDPKVSCFSSFKSKSKPMKVCNLKQPISPGLRLTNFINSIFTNANGKTKKKTSCSSNSSTGAELLELRQCSPRPKEQRRVRFLPPQSVILDAGCDKCSNKKPPSPPGRGPARRESGNEDAFSDCSDDLFEIDHLAIP